MFMLLGLFVFKGCLHSQFKVDRILSQGKKKEGHRKERCDYTAHENVHLVTK